jgi:hypothetical protein
MARSEARLSVAIWSDDDFLALGAGAQRMYMFLLSQPDLAHTGVLALRERRWSKAAAGLTTAAVSAAVAELHAARFVVVDEDAEELLVRSFIRRDKVYRQPNVLAAAVGQVPVITSVPILAALAEELRRIAVADDVPAGSRKALDEMIAAVGNPTPKGSPNPPRGFREEVAEDLPSDPPKAPEADVTTAPTVSDGPCETAGLNPSGNPSGKGTANPPGDRGVVTDLGIGSPSPVPRAPLPISAPAAPPGTQLRLVDDPDTEALLGELMPAVAPPVENAGQLTAAWIDFATANGVKLTDAHIKRFGRGIKRALGEGFTVEIVKRALAEMLRDRVASRPGLLDNYLVRVQQGPELPPRRATPGEASVIRMSPPGEDVAALIHDALWRPA